MLKDMIVGIESWRLALRSCKSQLYDCGAFESKNNFIALVSYMLKQLKIKLLVHSKS